MGGGALDGVRVCDFSGQLAGAGATKALAAFGAQVIRIEDPVAEGRWDILRGNPPWVNGHRGVEGGAGFNNHNVEKLGITLNLRTPRGRELLAELVRVSDVVAENFAAGVLERWGFGYERLKELRPDVVYVSHTGFGHTGPYRTFKSWGPIAQAVSGLTAISGLPDLPPAGWGYSYLDHTGASYVAMAILMALYHRGRTGEGQWVDVATFEAAGALSGPLALDWTVNGRGTDRPGFPHSNRSEHPAMAPHGIYPADGDDQWVAVACRDDDDFRALAGVVDEPWARDGRWGTLIGRLLGQDQLDEHLGRWTATWDRHEVAARLRDAGVPAAAVARPADRLDHDPSTRRWGLWPEVDHALAGPTRVDGLPVHLDRTDWVIERAGPTLGQDNDRVYGELLGLDADERAALRADGVI